MKSKRPFSSNPFKSSKMNKKSQLKLRLNSALNNYNNVNIISAKNNRRLNTLNNFKRPITYFQAKTNVNLFSRNEEEK